MQEPFFASDRVVLPNPANGAMLAEEQYRKMMADQEYMSLYTLWIITEKEDKHLVGYLYFLGRPSDTEAVELNGFIKPAYRRRGYMTEALKTPARVGLC